MSGRETICSVTGEACQCLHSGACRSRLDETPVEALQWARTSVFRLNDAVEALDLAIDELLFERPFPSPEWREVKDRIEKIISDLNNINKG